MSFVFTHEITGSSLFKIHGSYLGKITDVFMDIDGYATITTIKEGHHSKYFIFAKHIEVR